MNLVAAPGRAAESVAFLKCCSKMGGLGDNPIVRDSNCYVAAMGELPRVTFFAGVAYAIPDLYHYWRAQHH